MTAAVGAGTSILATEAVQVTAQDTPSASATALGVAVSGGLAVGVVISDASSSGTTSSTLGNGDTISASSIQVSAERSPDSNNDPTAKSTATAGAGGILAGVDATVSQATGNGTVEACTGSSVVLMGGGVSIQANNQSLQSSSATGVAVGGLLGIGADVAVSSSDVNTSAQLGAGATVMVAGTLDVSANGTDENDASTTAGSGGVIAGDAAVGQTSDDSTVSATIAGDLMAGTVDASAVNNSVFTPQVDSTNAALAGASGALANNTDNTAADTTVGNNTLIVAASAVDITAQNTFTENLPTSGNTVSAGAGGFLNGTAALSTTTITGNSDVTIESSVTIDVPTASAESTGTPGILLTASSVLNTNDQVSLGSGGVLEGAGTDSSLTATLNNNVTTDSTTSGPDVFATNQNIGIGTFSSVDAASTSEAHTWGVLGAVASSSALTGVTSNQTVALGPDTNLTAAQNINLTAGDDPTPGDLAAEPMVGNSNAQSYARSFVAIPAASATTDLTSNATLTVGAGDQIESGENTTLAADHGTPSATAIGIGHGYELGFIPVTDGSSKPSVSTGSSVTMDGSITAGYLHTLNITIPDNQSAPGGFYSNDVTVNGSTLTSVSTAPAANLVSPADTAAFTASFDPSFNPYNTIVAAAADGEFPDSGEAMADEDAVHDGPVGAMVLGTLFAAGGDVTVSAGAFQGDGSITAYGGPTITVTNNSPDYLVLDSINIPDEPGGQVVYTGLAVGAPSSMQITQSGSNAHPVVNIQELYGNPVPASSDSTEPGPSVFATATMDNLGNVTLDPSGSVDNEGGQVAITVLDGSLIQAGGVSASQVNFTTEKGVTAISNPTGLSGNAGTPATDWDTAMYWPDFYDPYTDAVMPSDLASVYVAFVANSMFNADGQYGSDPSDIGSGPFSISARGSGTGDDGFTEDLIGTVGQTPPLSFAYDPGEGLYNDEPAAPDIVNGAPQAGTSVEFLGANTGDSTVITPQEAAQDSPVDGAYQFGDISGRGEVPVVPVEPLPVTTAAYQPTFTGSLTSGSTSVTVPDGVTGMFTGEEITGTGIAPGTTIAVSNATFTLELDPGAAVVLVISNGPAPVIGSTVTGDFISTGTTVQSIAFQDGNIYDVQISAPVASDAPGNADEPITLSNVTLSAPATVTGTEGLTLGSASAIDAAAVFINALYVDVNEPINVGQPSNDSLSLPASLNSTIAQDQLDYNNGTYSTTPGDARGYYTLPASTVSPGDTQITAEYDAITGQIIVNDVSASSGGFISLDGAIMSTNTFGELNVNSDLGQVTIDNTTNYPIVVNDVSASKSTTSTSLSGVDIIDTNQPAATEQTLFVYQPGSVIDEYQGTAGQTQQQLEQGSPVAVIQGSSTSYSPEAGLRWEWQLQTDLTRTITQNSGTGEAPFSASPWAYTAVSGNPENDPWYYLTSPNGDISDASSQPAGWTVVDAGLPAFEETISGNVLNWYMADYIYHNGDYGFAPTDPPVDDSSDNDLVEDPWAYYFATEAELTLTESVKADNPIGIDFSGSSQATVSITSDTPVILAGNIANPLGDTTITAPSITQEPSATITTNNLTLTATGGGVGTATEPIDANLTANGVLNAQAGSEGVYVNLGSGALLGEVSAGNRSTGYGDVVLSATGSLTVAPGLPSGTVNVTGNNIALTSTEGAVGTAAAPLVIQAQGVVNVAALQDIDLTQAGTSLQVGQIVSTTGDVTIDVPSGSIVNASGTTWTDQVDSPQSQQVWTSLGLTAPAASEQQAITAFQNEVNADYVAYWQLLDNGTVLDGVFTLNAPAVALYSGQAALALDITNPTTAQVQGYANSQYQDYVSFFNQNLDSNWMSEPEFQADDLTFSYVATSQQVSNLESNATWTNAELMNPVAEVAVDPADGTPVGIWTPNISGANVTLVTGGSIGQTSAAVDISMADVQSWTLTTNQESAIANATAPGDVVVTSGGDVEVSPDSQVFISSTGDLNATATGSITVQGTTPDLTLNTVTAGGAVNITAQGSILGSGTGTQITTPGNTVLKAGTGTLGSPSTPLIVSVGGQLHPYAPPGNIYLNGLTAIPATLNAVEGQPLSSTVSSHIVVASFDALASITDPNDFTATIAWGDGTAVTPGVIAYDATAGDFDVWASTDHVYTGTGVYNVAVTIDEVSDGVSVVADSTAVIQAAELEADPSAPGSLMLAVGGTTGSSDIVFGAAPGTGDTVVTLNGTVLGTFQPTSRTLIFGQSGNDQFEVDAPLTVPVFVDATTGTNSLMVVGDGANDAFTVTSNSVTVASPLSGNTPLAIALENIESVTIDGGTGDDVFTVDGTAPDTTTTVNTGTGADTVNVQAIGAATSINAGGGNDTINVSSGAPASTGTLAGIAAVLTVNGGSGTSTANVSDAGDSDPSTSTLSGTGLTSTAFGSGSLSYSSLAALNVSLGSGGNSVTVAGTAGGTSTTVNSGAGSDTVNVMGTSSPLTVNTQTGTDTVNVQAIGAPASINAGGGNDRIDVSSGAPANTGTLSGIAAVLTVNGGPGTSTANVSDTGDGHSSTSTLNGTALTSTAFGSGGGLNYSSLAALNASLGSGGNTVTVAGTASGTSTTVNSGAGSDTVNVMGTSSPLTVNTQTGTDTVNVQAIGAPASINAGGGNDRIDVSSGAPANTGTLSGIAAVLTVNGGPGTSTANVSDTGDGHSSTSTLNGTALTSTAFGSGGGLSYSSLAALNASLGSGGNTVTVAGTASGTSTTVNSGAGSDTVNVMGTSSPLTVNTQTGTDTVNVQAIGAPASINAGGGNDTIDVSSNAPANTGTLAGIAAVLTVNGGSGTSTANVSDTGDGHSSTSTLNGTALTSTAFGSGGGLSYSSLAALNASLGSGGNTVTVANTAGGTNTTVNCGKGSDTVNVTDTSSPLTVNTQTGTDTVNVQAIGAAASINAGGGNDTINVSSNAPANTGTLAGIAAVLTVNGGSGTSTANVSDTGDGNASTSTLNGTGLTSTAFGSGGGLSYSSLAALNVSLGSGGNTVTVANTAGGTNTTVNSGKGSDTVNVQATSGPTTVNTGGGSNTNVVNVGSLEPATGGIVGHIQGALTVIGDGGDTMNVDDTGDTSSHAATLTPTTLTGLGMGTSGIAYSGLANLNISLGSGGATGNSFAINAPAGQNLPVDTTIVGGSAGHDALAANWTMDFNGTLNLSKFTTSTITVGNNFNGSMNDTNPGTIQSIAIGGSLSASGALHVASSSDPANPTSPTGLLGSIGTMTVGGSLAGTVQVSGNIATLDVGPANTATTGDVNDVSGQVRVGGQLTTASVSGNISGSIEETLTINSLYIGGSLTQPGLISAVNTVNPALGNINTLTIGKDLDGTLIVSGTIGTFNLGGSLGYTSSITLGTLNSMTIHGDLAGRLDILGTLGELTVDGGTPGTIAAGQIGTIGVYGGYGPIVARIEEDGIQRYIEATVASALFPTPPPPPAPTPAISPAGITFQYFYEGLDSPTVEGLKPSTNLANPQLTARVKNATGNTGPDQFDFSLITYSDTAKFNLARLDSASVPGTNPKGVSGIGNIAVEGDILTKVTAAASAFFAPDSAPAGVYLPQDNLAGVAVRDYVPDQSIAAQSIQAVAFGSMSGSFGRIETGASASAWDAANLLAPCTTIVQAGSTNGTTAETFRVPFADLSTEQVGFFMDDEPSWGDGQFDNNSVVLEVQGVSTANSSGTGNIVTQSNVARGAVVALVTVAETFDSHQRDQGSQIETIFLEGDGGSIQTQQTIGDASCGGQPAVAFTPSITSTGPLGDVIVGGPLPNVTAPSIFGSLVPCGPIPSTTTIHTTGIRTDPITGQTSQVPADLGRVYVENTGCGSVLTTSQVVSDGGFAGQIICGGNLISQVVSNGPTTGTILVQPVAWEPGSGNLGTTFTYLSGKVADLGGFTSNGPMSGPTISAGQNGGTTNMSGTVQGGTITTYGSVIGDIDIDGALNGPTVSDSGCGKNTEINVNGSVQGGSIITYGSVIGDIDISGPMNGPTVSASNNNTEINLNGILQGGFITTYGSVIGDINVGSMNGPTICAGNNGTTINVNPSASLQGGSITTAGSVVGSVDVCGSMNGPTISGGNNNSVIDVNGPVQGGCITTSGALNGSITINGSMNGPIISAGNHESTVTISSLVQGGSIVTTGSDIGSISIGGGVNAPNVSGGCNGGTVPIEVAVQGGSILTGGSLGNLTIGGPLSGEIVAIGNMTGTINVGALEGGLIATAGSINGNLTMNGSLTGDLVSVGNINGNITIKGSLQSGTIASLGSIPGNLTITGSIDSQSAIVAGEAIGNKTAGTGLSAGTVSGVLVSVGPMNVIKIGSTSKAVLYKQNDTTDAAVIDAIFSQGLLSSLSPTDLFDHATSLDLENLSELLANLNSLTVKSGKLQIG